MPKIIYVDINEARHECDVSAGISVMEGTYNEKTKTMTEIAVDLMPDTEMRMKNVIKEIDKDTLVFSMYMVNLDKTETLGMQITYRRAK